MRMSKIIAGMSAIALAAAVAVPVSADAPEENGFYNATGTWHMTYNGSTIVNNGMITEKDPGEDWKAPDDASAQLIGYTNEETGATTWNLGFNMQVGHMKKAKVTVHVTSNHANILNDGPDGGASTEGYMYTVQASWNGDSPADFQEGWTHEYDADGNKKMANGATDVNGWNSGSTKYNGNWIQLSLNDDDVSALTFDVTVEADDKTTWEYHAYDDSKEVNEYEIFRFGCGNLFLADSIDGDHTLDGYPVAKQSDNGQGSLIASTFVDSDYINAQFGGTTSPSSDGGDESSEGDGDSSNGDNSNGNSSNGDSSNGSSSNGGGSSSNGGSNGGGGSNKNGGGSTGGSTSTSSTGDGEAASDATENADSGAAAGVGFAIAALAGAAVVVSRKR